ncbi:hypothetical protein FJY84_03300 [Candidatus Bathyarchaeota archaeon]|nr:hypothetical protein [Candidatus Bathyarchaeota archaeon]
MTHAHEEGFCIAEGVCPYLKGDQCELGDNRPIKCTDRFKALDASLEKDARDLFIDIRNTFITHYEEIYIITLFASQVLDGLFVLDEKTGKYDLTEKGRKFFKSDIPYLT